MHESTQTSPKKVLIIGGGFAGVACARGLARNPHYEVQLISDSDHFKYYPALYSSATGHSSLESWIPLETLLADVPQVQLAQATIKSIDPAAHTLTDEAGKTYTYDIAVLALGVVTSYFGVPGLEQYSYGIKSMEGVLKLRDHLHKELVDTGHPDKNYCVVGAGPTGVELAAALVSYLRRIAMRHGLPHEQITIDLIEAAPRILPRSGERASAAVAHRLTKLGVNIMTGKQVQGESPDTLMVGGRPLPTETVIWTAGVTNNPFFAANADKFKADDHHKIVVDEHMMAAPDVFVLGDNASTPYSGLAQIAVGDGKFLADHLARLASGRALQPRRFHRPITAIPVGKNWAVAEYAPFTVTGWLVHLARRAADFIGYWDITSLGTAFMLWKSESSTEENCAICRENQKK
ncbi:MAG TPA: FAD-dependent oxidoreductase [Candidatus Acidoferrum sp.]|nr:FAD-dependent oxidoreductase [Candidatus Acidoferrum sp.]